MPVPLSLIASTHPLPDDDSVYFSTGASNTISIRYREWYMLFVRILRRGDGLNTAVRRRAFYEHDRHSDSGRVELCGVSGGHGGGDLVVLRISHVFFKRVLGGIVFADRVQLEQLLGDNACDEWIPQ